MSRKKKEERWVSAREATRILEEKAGRPIARNYIGILVKLGKVEARPVDGRTNEYKASDLENYVIKPRGKKRAEDTENSSMGEETMWAGLMAPSKMWPSAQNRLDKTA